MPVLQEIHIARIDRCHDSRAIDPNWVAAIREARERGAERERADAAAPPKGPAVRLRGARRVCHHAASVRVVVQRRARPHHPARLRSQIVQVDAAVARAVGAARVVKRAVVEGVGVQPDARGGCVGPHAREMKRFGSGGKRRGGSSNAKRGSSARNALVRAATGIWRTEVASDKVEYTSKVRRWAAMADEGHIRELRAAAKRYQLRLAPNLDAAAPATAPAAELPLRSAVVDAVVVDLPFGMGHKMRGGGAAHLYARATLEAARVLVTGGRFVALTPALRVLTDCLHAQRRLWGTSEARQVNLVRVRVRVRVRA